MPKVNIYCELKLNGVNDKISSEYNLNFCREVDVPSSDLTVFYYAIRSYFRKNLSDSEKTFMISHLVDDKDSIRLIKRRKNVSLRDIFPNNYFVEGVEKVGPNKYQLLWGI